MTTIKVPATKKRAFRKAVDEWIDNFGLKEWHLEVQGVEYPPENDGESVVESFAFCSIHVPLRSAIISANAEWLMHANTEVIKQVAFHEVCHLLLADLADLTSARSNQATRRLEATEHAIIRRLENALFGPN